MSEVEATVDPEVLYDLINDTLERYGSDDSVLDVSELDGYFAALACSPAPIDPADWIAGIWDGDEPDWADDAEEAAFMNAVGVVYDAVRASLEDGEFSALFLEGDDDGEDDPLSVDGWCYGFLRGLELWDEEIDRIRGAEQLLAPVQLFGGDDDVDHLEADQIAAEQQRIEPAVQQLYDQTHDIRRDD